MSICTDCNEQYDYLHVCIEKECTPKVDSIEGLLATDWQKIINAINTPEHIYVIEARPAGKKSVRVHNNRAYNPSKEIMDQWAWQLKAQHRNKPLFTQPLHLDITYAFKRPKSHSKKQCNEPWHNIRPDKDNCSKAVLDAATGILFSDDKICVSSYERKIWSAVDCIILKVKELV